MAAVDDGVGELRAQAACEVCRRRKRKCDGSRPRCAWCRERDLECHYVVDRPKKRKHDPTYVSELESHIELLKDEIRRLESLTQPLTRPKHIEELLSKEEAEMSSHVTMPGSTNDITEAPFTDSQRDLSSDPVALHDISAMVWRLKLGESGEPTFIGPSGNFCFTNASIDQEAAADVGNVHSDPYGFLNGSFTNPLDSDSQTQLDDMLVDLFSTHINPVHQFIDAKALPHAVSTNTLQNTLLRHAMIAAGSLYSDDMEAQAYGRTKASHFEQLALNASRRSPCVVTAVSLSIMCWRELALNQENMAWMYNAMACSMAQHLGLPAGSIEMAGLQETLSETNIAQNPIVSRPRALWSIVMLDRIATSLLGRNCLIPWRRVRAPTLLETLGSSATTDEIAFDFHCKLWFLHDQHMDKIYSFEFNALPAEDRYSLLVEARESLQSFRRHFLSKLRSGNEASSSSIIWAHISFLNSQLLIHRPYVQDTSYKNTSRLALRSMMTAATEMVHLIRTLDKRGVLDKSPFFISHSILTAAILLLLTSTSEHVRVKTQSVSRLRTCMDALETLGRRWPGSKMAIDALRSLAYRWRAVTALPIRFSAPLPIPHSIDTSSGCTPSDTLARQADMTQADFVVEQADAGFAWEPMNLRDFQALDWAGIDLSGSWYDGLEIS